MSGTRILLIAQKEMTQFCRGRKALLLTIAMVALGISQVIILRWVLPPPVLSFNAVLYGTYNVFVQLLPLVMVVVLATSICGEKENRVWGFYLSKPFRESEIVLGKILFYNSVVLLVILLTWLTTIAVSWWITKPANALWRESFHVSIIVLSVAFSVINVEMMFSSLARKTVTAALLIVIAWIALTIGNAALKVAFGEGIIAPYAAQSIQTDIVMRVLGMVVPDCPSCPPPPYPSTVEITKACLHALLVGGLFAALAIFVSDLMNYSIPTMALRNSREMSETDHANLPTKELVNAQEITFSYKRRRALQNVSFQVREGQFFCLIGPNGAGKSTLFKILTGRLRPQTGNITILGQDVKTNPHSVRHHIGVLTDDMAIPDDFTVTELLVFAARSFGQSRDEALSTAQEIMAQLDLLEEQSTNICKLSSGLRRRVEIGQALVNKAPLLLLDEPTINLDPVSSQEIRNLIKNIHAQGTTILYTTHLLHEVEELCTHLAVLDAGRIKLYNSIENLRCQAQRQSRIELRSSEDLPRALALLKERQIAVQVENHVLVIPSTTNETHNLILDILSAAHIKVTNAIFHIPTLADIYAQALAGDRC